MSFRFDFRELPSSGGKKLTPRPVVDVWLEGIEVGAWEALADTGAVRTCFSRDLAQAAGITPDDDGSETLAIAGAVVQGSPARVTLTLKSQDEEYAWDAPVWFCEPWPFSFQLVGLEGFFHHFDVHLSAYEGWLDCRPVS